MYFLYLELLIPNKCRVSDNMAKEMVIVMIVSMGLLFLSSAIEPYERPFSISDRSISKPYLRHETITFAEITAVSVVIPLVLMFVILRINTIERVYEVYFYLSFLLACLITSSIVENMKNIIGRLRPDFLSRCSPAGGKCTGNPRVILEGRRSFPSGHTSIAACGFIFLMLFASKEFGLPRLRAKMNQVFVFLLYLAFLMVPIAVGASRVMDSKHFISDVVGGGVIGVLVGVARFKRLEMDIVKERYKNVIVNDINGAENQA
ncbi:membrane associated phosphatidic acid [Encephalitozoon romaleae SJ-2008]|uniref:Membrane associated phosphatidic acid n=1 Tax=Encephalitozoon romaleae (strain SJ-2008) TaxID=1178016 RepID=I6ZKV6_ENCRO|nr:membrane associated phosphatidic acid [Encephalitozoon romaleae SJ-2008]AFN83948.1 membrane associated phosphatidic acid [Encephalitozoon romaleae SJ-2008]